MSQEQLAEMTNKTQEQISNLERGTAGLNWELAKRLASIFDVSVEELYGEERTQQTNLRPVYASVPAGKGSMSKQFAMEEAPPGVKDNGNGYWLKVKGDSMSPKYEDGEMVFVNPEKEVRNKDYVVAIWDERKEGAIKRVHFSGDDVILTSINPAYEPITIHKNKISILSRICYLKS